MHRLLLAVFLALSAAALAQTSSVPGYISYQGKITDATGTPIGDTAPVNRVVIFRVWDSPTATAVANRLYSEQQNVTISGGEFSVLIGAGTPVAADTGNAFSTFSSAVFAGATRYLGVTVDDGDTNLTNDPESSPRQQVVATAFAFRAQVAEAVAAGGIVSSALANNAVGSAALATGAVTTDKLASQAVLTAALADGSVTAAKLAAAAVQTAGLADGAVTAAKLATGAIDTTKIADGGVTLAKLGNDSVTSAKIVDGSIVTADLANNAVTTAKITDLSVTNAKLADTAVDTAKLADSAVTLAKHAADSVDGAKIVDGSITLADLTTSVRDVLPKARAIYNQAKTPTVDSVGWTLVPIDLGDLGNDADGCRLQLIAVHKTTVGAMYASDMFLWVQEAGFTSADSNNFTQNNQRWLIANWNNSGTVNSGTTRLPPISYPSQNDRFAAFTVSGDDWVKFYNFYPGGLRSGDSDRANSPGIAQGPADSTTLNITSIVTGANKLTITVDNPHALQVGDSVKLNNITGTPSATGTKTVTAQPDRTSFEVALTGASGTYSGGTVTYTPSFNRYRIWAAVHPSLSARFIVSDR